MLKLIFVVGLAGMSLGLWFLGLSNGGQNFGWVLVNLFCVSPLLWFVLGRVTASGAVRLQKPLVFNWREEDFP